MLRHRFLTRLLSSLILTLFSVNCYATTEFICEINGGSTEDYNVLSTWEAAMDDCGDIRNTTGIVATGNWDAQSGTIADGADITWNSGTDDGTFIHMTDDGATGTFLVKGDDSGDIDNLADDDVISDGTNTITVNGTPDESVILVAECYDDDGKQTDSCSIQLYYTKTNATNYFKVTVPEGERHDGTTAGAGFTVRGSVTAYYTDYTVIEWVRMDEQDEPSNDFRYGNACSFRNLVIYDRPSDYGASLCIRDGGRCTYYNILISGGQDNGFNLDDYGGTGSDVYNCSVYSSTGRSDTYGFYSSNADNTIINCVAIGATNGANFKGEVKADSAYNASQDSTASNETGYSNGITGIDPSTNFVGWNTGDLHLLSGASSLIDAGSSASGIFTTDIDGETRSAWDVGYDEYVSAVTAAGQIMKLNIY